MLTSFRKNVFLSALFFVIVVSIICFSIILVYDNYQRGSLFEDYLQLEQQIVLDDVYSAYMASSNDINTQCTVLKNQITNQFKINDYLLKKLKTINKKGIVTSDNKIKYTYILTNIKLWLHYKKLKELCNTEAKVGMYFYPETKNMPGPKAAELDAKTQAFEYALKQKQKEIELGILALPYNLEIPIIKQIVSDYNISTAPAVFYNDTVYYNVEDIY